VNNSSSVESMIHNVVTVVFRIHFYYIRDPELEMDLKQEGYLKAYELLAAGNYDPSKNLRTFIYTGVRNAMTNYMYHHNKENHIDLDTITSQMWQRYESITMDNYWEGKIFYNNDSIRDKYEIDLPIIFEICDKYSMFGDYTNIIINELCKLGIYQEPVKVDKNFKPVPLIKDAILAEIIYTTLRRL